MIKGLFTEKEQMLYTSALLLSMTNKKERLFKTKVGQASTGI